MLYINCFMPCMGLRKKRSVRHHCMNAFLTTQGLCIVSVVGLRLQVWWRRRHFCTSEARIMTMLVLLGSSCGSLPDVPVTATACTLLTNISSQCSLNTRVVLKYMRACCEGGGVIIRAARWSLADLAASESRTFLCICYRFQVGIHGPCGASSGSCISS